MHVECDGDPRDAGGHGPRPRFGVPEILVLALAAVVRIGWACVSPVDLWFDHVFNDATAWNLSRGHGFTASAGPPWDPAIFRTPGYPAFLAAVYGLAGHSVRAGYMANALLDTASCMIAWSLAARTFGSSAAFWTLALAATYPFTVHAVGALSPESLLLFLGLLLVAALRAWPERGLAPPVLLAGLLVASLAWVKPVFLPLPAALIALERARRRPWRVALGRAAVVGGIAFALFAPWVLRSQREFGRPVLAGEFGLVVWHGTRDFHPHLEGEIRANFERSPADPGERYEATRRALAASGPLLEQDRRLLESGLRVMREHPLDSLLLDPLRRIPALWISARHVLLPSWVGTGAAAACLAYLLLSVAGCWVARGRLQDLAPWSVIPLTLTLVYAGIHAEARYTLPARPVLWILGGIAVAAWTSRSGPGALPDAPSGRDRG